MSLQSTTLKSSPPRNRPLLSALSIAVLLTCSACSETKPLEVVSAPVQVQRPPEGPTPLPAPRPVDLQRILWKVLTPQTPLPEGDDWVLYVLTPEEYEVLSTNMAELLRWVKEAGWQLDYYAGGYHAIKPQ